MGRGLTMWGKRKDYNSKLQKISKLVFALSPLDQPSLLRTEKLNFP